ncbi:MAG: hypothetical protein PVJ60_04435 [Phycisphaerales bacterium]|jgi:hypothetical protein
MKFYGRGKVWDKENEKVLMSFPVSPDLNHLGEYETNDKRICKILTDLGYGSGGDSERQSLPDTPYVKPTDGVSADMKMPELRKIGKQYGLAFKPGTTKDDMAKAINEAMEREA